MHQIHDVSLQECSQVLEYLKNATPRFHINGKHVTLGFSAPISVPSTPAAAPSSTTSAASVQAANAAIQAAQWSQHNKGVSYQVANYLV